MRAYTTNRLIVCEYYEPGNVLGNFAQNVQRSLPAPHMTINSSKTCVTKVSEHTESDLSLTKTANYTVEPVDIYHAVIPTIQIVLWIAMEEQ